MSHKSFTPDMKRCWNWIIILCLWLNIKSIHSIVSLFSGSGLAAQCEVWRPQWPVLSHQPDGGVWRLGPRRGPRTEAAQARPRQDELLPHGAVHQPQGEDGRRLVHQLEPETSSRQDARSARSSRLVRMPGGRGRASGDHLLRGGWRRGRPHPPGHHPNHPHARRGGAQREVCRARGKCCQDIFVRSQSSHGASASW